MPHIKKSARTSLILACLIVLHTATGEEGKSPGDEPLDWDDLLEETEALLEWSDDPLADLFEEPEESLAFWSAGLRIGPGYSDNFLKRPQPAGSRYLKAEGEILANILFGESALTALLYSEYSLYDSETDADSETILLFNGSWTRFTDPLNYGLEAGAFYGDQIFDASLTVDSEPSGTSLRQLRSQVQAFMEWAPGRRDLLKGSAGIARAAFGDSEDDYWEPSVSVDWTHAWSKTLQSTTRLSTFAEIYDEDLARSASGAVLNPETRLEIHGLSIDQSLDWEPTLVKDLRLSLKTGASGEFESEGDYKGSSRLWVSYNTSWKWHSARFGLSARWQKTAYEDRYSGFFDARPLKYTYRHLKMEWVQSLPWNLALEANIQWATLDSRAETDSFSEQRAEILLGWTY